MEIWYLGIFCLYKRTFNRRGSHQHRHRGGHNKKERGEHSEQQGLGDRCCRSACKLSQLYAACWSFNTSFRDLFKTSVFLLNSRIAQPTSLDVDCLLMSSVSFKKTPSPPSSCKKLGDNISCETSDHILKITRTTHLLWNISQQCTFATIFKIDTTDKFWL